MSPDRPASEQSGRSTRFGKLRQLYGHLAVFVLNTLLVLILFNLALHAAFAGHDALRRTTFRDWQARYAESRKGASSGADETEIQQLVRETLRGSHVYEPFTEFRDRSQRGRYVNVDENGFRHSSAQAPWPPSSDSFNVFFFGGSTVFGWKLPDASTIPSWFQRLLPQVGGKRVSVYNFARTAYFSTQERILLEQLILAGHEPDAAIFVDGLNDLQRRDGKPLHAPRLAALIEGQRTRIGEWPMVRLARAIRRLPLERVGHPVDDQGAGDELELFQAALARYLVNKKLIESASATWGVIPIFVWQPVAAYKYDSRQYPFRKSRIWQLARLDAYTPAYDQMEAGSRIGAWGPNFLWCGDVQEGLDEDLYLDTVHYTPRLSQLVAECIARQIRERGLLPVGGR